MRTRVINPGETICPITILCYGLRCTPPYGIRHAHGKLGEKFQVLLSQLKLPPEALILSVVPYRL